MYNITGTGGLNPYDPNLNGFDNKNNDNDVRHFAELLIELSKYNSDLKAILHNSKSSVNQNQDSGFRVSPYDVSNGGIESNPFLNSEDLGNNQMDHSFNTIGNNVNISESKPIIAEVAADSIYNLLTSQCAIIVDVLKLPEYLQQIVNKLTNNNNLNNQSEMKTEGIDSSSNVINNPNKESVALNASQFQDLIYYFIIDAVAKENCMTVTDNCDHSQALTDAKQAITGQFQGFSQQIDNYTQIESINKCAPDDINQTVSNLKNNVENGELQKIIKDNVENANESSGFWVQFLCSVLKRASFVYSLCQFFACTQKLKCFDTLKEADIDKRKFMDNQKLESDRKNHLIDTFLSIPQILLLLSLIFGFGAIANVILGLIVLATFVYKFINQYPKQKQKFLVYKLLQSNYFGDLAKRNGLALMPEVAKIYQYGEETKENIKQIADNKLNSINQNTLGYVPVKTQEQYPSLAQLNQFDHQ